MNLYYNYKIYCGLQYAKGYAKTEKNIKAYEQFKKEIYNFSNKETDRDIRYIANDISPGLAHVDIINSIFFYRKKLN